MRSSSHVATLAFAMTLVSLALEPGVGPPARAQSAVSANGLVESTSGGFKFPDGTIQATAAVAGSAPVEDTGQVGCWDTAGNPVACAGSGQDGEFLAGVAWPTPRFADNSDGTVTDNLTGLIWLQQANCFGLRTWADALTDATGLTSGLCGLSDGSVAGDWRLPNVNELTSLVHYGSADPAIPPGHPFTSVQSATYWSSSTNVTDEEYAWIIFMFSGGGNHSLKSGTGFVWPVRGGHE